MHLRICYLLAVFLLRSFADANNEIKKGKYPYMAFIYYPDDSVVDKNGVRVTRAGILLKPNWLVTSSLENDDVPMAFQQKTLVARLGSVYIDSNFSINEDEDEQESEVIQIIRPYNFSAIEWWFSDISLLKTLVPFNLTTAVAIAPITHKADIDEKECFILFYARNALNKTTDKVLTQIPVDVISPANGNCGNHFKEKTMICARDIEDRKNVTYDPNFCIGNGGGPLVCANIIYGLQTYSSGCQEPYLYQIFSGWVDFISCGIQDICQEKQCDKICTVINKDADKYITQPRVSQEITTKEITETISESENDSGEEISPEKPTVTTSKDLDIQDTTLTTSLLVENSSENLASAESTAAENLRRTNIAAQEQPVTKKSSAIILTPFSTQLPILFWVAINFA